MMMTSKGRERSGVEGREGDGNGRERRGGESRGGEGSERGPPSVPPTPNLPLVQ